jgi:hypothetical protein
MKRAISIILLAVLSVTSIRPTVAVHFCGGALRAIGLTDEGMEANCCGEMENEADLPTGTAAFLPDDPCCATRVTSIATDDFRSAPGTAVTVAWIFAPVAALIPRPWRFPRMFHASSPVGKPPAGGDLLTLIRVARI